jgi:tyrosine decarboxylase/aspartate 1-decarboxylase
MWAPWFATLGTTALGAVDPLDQILALRARYGFRIHVDAAYGGYFVLIPEALGERARRAYAAICQADSIVIDPHKHGLQPYGCGCILFRDPEMGRLYKHDSPYTYFTSQELHLGEISLECSRAGASAVALWATQQLLPLTAGGGFARGLQASRGAALELDRRLRSDSRFQPLLDGPPELDIVVWAASPAADRSAANARAQSQPRQSQNAQTEAARKIFAACAARDLHLALVQLPPAWFGAEEETSGRRESEPLTCLRSVLMKPEHERWLDAIWDRLSAACGEVGAAALREAGGHANL